MTDATGPISKPFEEFARLIAACPAFQAMVGAADAAEALTHVFYPEVDMDPDDPDTPIPQRPFCVVTDDDECQWQLNPDTRRAWGELKVSFEANVPAEVNEKSSESLKLFCNWVGLTMLNMAQLEGTPDPDGRFYQKLGMFTKVVTPQRCSYKQNPNPNIPGHMFWGSTHKIEWLP